MQSNDVLEIKLKKETISKACFAIKKHENNFTIMLIDDENNDSVILLVEKKEAEEIAKGILKMIEVKNAE